ncbi:MAG TPA: hypothetical protein VIL49_10190 [Capillimicrobium sp.]|jgi:hypothetical protein
MERFYAQLADTKPVTAEFLAVYGEDLDGEGRIREDLGAVAAERVRVWKPQGDAVAAAWELFHWLTAHVLPAAFPDIQLPRVDGIADAGPVDRELRAHAEQAGDRWHERHQANSRDAEPEWVTYQALLAAAEAAKALSWLPRRMSVKKHKPKLRRGDTPLDLCVSAAGNCAAAHVYVTEGEPWLGRLLDRLAEADYTDAAADRRGRDALHAAGVTEFGRQLERLARRVVDAYDRAAAREERMTPAKAAAAGESALPNNRHLAVVMVAESPQLGARPVPADAGTFVDAAWDVIERAVGEVAVHLHAHSSARR